MNLHLKKVEKESRHIRNYLRKDKVLEQDIDFDLNFIPPFSNAESVDNVKLIVIGQDPTIRNIEARKAIKSTLNLDKKGSLNQYVNRICEQLNIDFEKEMYATNLYKCFFNHPPADDKTILNRHFKIWIDCLVNELTPFKNATIITLGEPILKQIVSSKNKEVRQFWAYTGNTESNKEFKMVKSDENYLQKMIFPFPHQPAFSRNKFYQKYFDDYAEFAKNKLSNK